MKKENKGNMKKTLTILTAFTIGLSSFAPLTQYVVSADSLENNTEITEGLDTEENEQIDPIKDEEVEKTVILEEVAKEPVIEEQDLEIAKKLTKEETDQIKKIVDYIDQLPELEDVNLSNSRIPSEYIRGEIEKLSDVLKEEITNLEKLVAIEEKVQELMNTIVKEPAPATEHGSRAYDHVVHLSENLSGDRVSGTEYELEAANYIKDQFESYNYETKLVPFTFEGTSGDQKGKTIDSQNIIAVKEGTSGKEIILGAHYDQVIRGDSHGASDNASGVGGMLEVAERLKDIQTEHTIVFVAFGSEEVGLKGSKAFVNMNEFDAGNVLGMINLDTILAGDYAYVYSGTNGKGLIRDKALSISENLDLDLVTQEGEVEGHKYGETGDWSDHAPFNELGIPVAYFESTSWKIRDEDYELMDGYTETDRGSIMHSGRDTLEYINSTFPGRAMKRLNTFVRVLEPLMKDLAVVVKAESELDRTQLEAVTKKANDLVQDNYTPASWAPLATALAMDESTQEEIDAKVKAIQEALDGLVLVEETPTEDSTDETDSGITDKPDKGTPTDIPSDSKEAGKLPRTGEADYQGQVWGLISILSGSALVFGLNYKKRKNLISKNN